jgi:hypothetical protein
MSKRTPGLPRRPRGFWPTPIDAVRPLIPYLPERAWWIEPCAGDGALVRHLSALWPGSSLAYASDLVPQADGIEQMDALSIDARPDLYITNPPWPVGGMKGDPALSIIVHLMGLAPSWMLLPWDFGANVYFREVQPACVRIVPIGRVSWLGNGQGGMDNAAWYLFDARHKAGPLLHARAA